MTLAAQGAERSIPRSRALGCCCGPARHRALVLEHLADVASWIVVSPARQDFYGNRDRAERREMNVGRRMVFRRGGKKDRMSWETGKRKPFGVMINGCNSQCLFFHMRGKQEFAWKQDSNGVD